MVGGEKSSFCGGKTGVANLLAVFAEVSKRVTKRGVTSKAYPAFQKWFFAPGTLESQAAEGKRPNSSRRAALVQKTLQMYVV